ncbi:MAG: isochorismatase family cysteine hydrolase [Kiloniellales bacterium]|nr:isochorismatase family cysteine hydrolase [Kiloniellales bacterium]
MTEEPKRALIEGRPALLVIDIQEGSFHSSEDAAIPHMPGYAERMNRALAMIEKARACGVPVIFVQEAHRRDLVDFGRELDGVEDVHCLEGNAGTEYAARLGVGAEDYTIRKRRYSCFFGTDLEILLKGLGAQTLIMVGGLTDVCVHYTFVDGHQHDYFCRVVEDCVAGSSEAAHEASLRAMAYLQHGARRSLDEVVAAIESYAGSAHRLEKSTL